MTTTNTDLQTRAERAKCLIVDDLPENLLALSALLESDDVEVLKATSGPEALELLLVHDVALALLDVQMPGMDGFALAELMRGTERTRHVPIIFLTAGTHEAGRVFRGYDAGAVDVIFKPVEPQVLCNKAAVFFQLHRQKRQLAEQLRERSHTLHLNEMFMAVLAHDLRNPLNAMLLSSDLIAKIAVDDRIVRAARTMSNSGRRMHRMIDDLLDLVRARLAGGIQVRRASVDAAAIAAQAIGELGEARGAGVALAVDGDTRGDFDAGRLAQLLSNLVGNAIEHGRANTTIDVAIDGTDPLAVVLTVTNEGAIAPEQIPHVFDPFRSGRKDSTSGAGLGLGLYIVQQIALAHGGCVSVECIGGRTAFRVLLPRTAGPVEEKRTVRAGILPQPEAAR